MGIDVNCRGMDGDCRKLTLFEVVTLHRERERERERERCTNALRNWFILH